MPNGGSSASIAALRFLLTVSGFPTGFPVRFVPVMSFTGIPNRIVPVFPVSEGLNSRTSSPLSVRTVAEIS